MDKTDAADAAVALILCMEQVAKKYDLDYDKLADRVMEEGVDPKDIRGTVEKVGFEMRAPFVPLDYTKPWTNVDG